MSDMSKIVKEISRRNLFRHLGNAAIALPFMRTLLETQAFGEVARKRAVFFFYPNGIIRGDFHPTTAGTDFVLKGCTSNLDKIRKDIIIPLNLHYNINGSHEHGMQYCLTGVPDMKTGISIDTVLGDRMKAGASVPVVRLGSAAMIRGTDELRPASFFAVGKPSQIEDNPTRSFQNLFGSSGTTGTAAETIGLSSASRKSVLDSSLAELSRLQASLGSIEKDKLASHVEAVREIERRLQNAEGMTNPNAAQCTKTLKNTRTFPLTGNEWLQDAAYADVIALNIEIALQALACGVTNVLLLQNTHSVGQAKHDENGLPSAKGQDAHEDSHNDAVRHAKNINFYMGQFANLVQGMGALKEGDSSILYNSSVMAFSEFADCRAHDMKGVGVILAGQAGGYWKTGRAVDVKGASHNQMLVTLLQSLGYTDETFGDPNLGRGIIQAIRA